ncbi:unnamed protein product [Eruca vesicaria subsp. sativa]|uniref:Vitellogenin-like protein n=1 Tax=Eruca vesicaria subsp. sativa TaxID=29727 RepID=A0ABC8ITC1_ERUVS|nr:unnamed protein product [Eruca vesicaria subsp. sativa]
MVEAKDQDMGDGMQCVNHPFTKNPGGICAFCLQEKLGKLVTSSFPLPKHLSSSSTSSSPSFRSDSVGSTTTTTTTNAVSASLSLSASGARNVTANNNSNSKLPFLLAKKKAPTTTNIVYKRSQSTATYRVSDSSPRKRSGFWSFLHLHSYKHNTNSKKVGNFQTKHTENTLSKTEPKTEQTTTVVGSSSSSMSKRVNRNGIDVIVEEDGSPNNVSVTTVAAQQSERKVSRSRSVGCGSRSFSGDFFERITNGFGDCTLRRVESQREGSNKGGKVSGVREMVRCGGIFGGFMIMTSSSSSSSSSSWVSSSSSAEQQQNNVGHGGRNRSWGWAFASPMRAFSSSSTKRGRTITDSTSKNTAPNLDAIPSLLAVRS